MEMKCPNCGVETGWPPYTCGSCGTVVVMCQRCAGRGVVVQNHTPARPVRNAPPARPLRPDLEAVAATDRARDHLAGVVARPELPMADDDVDSFAQANLQSVDIDNPQEG